jgi:hypothetical protein
MGVIHFHGSSGNHPFAPTWALSLGSHRSRNLLEQGPYLSLLYVPRPPSIETYAYSPLSTDSGPKYKVSCQVSWEIPEPCEADITDFRDSRFSILHET